MLVERMEAPDAAQVAASVVVIRAENPFNISVRSLRERERLRRSELKLPVLVARSSVVVEPPDAALREHES